MDFFILIFFHEGSLLIVSLQERIFAIGFPCLKTCIISPSSTAENNADASFLNSVNDTLVMTLSFMYITYRIVHKEQRACLFLVVRTLRDGVFTPFKRLLLMHTGVFCHTGSYCNLYEWDECLVY